MNLTIRLKKNPFVRKAYSYFFRIPRYAKRSLAAKEEYSVTPPLIVNSFPKSGTHLLLQILEAIPDAKSYGTFIASMTSSAVFRERSLRGHLNLLRQIVPNELVLAHLFYSPAYEMTLDGIHAVHYFIFRDPRDVAVSEAYYLTYMNTWHRMHPYYKKLPTQDERIAQAILGVEDGSCSFDYPNIARRFRRYAGWLDSKDVFAVKFEDLIGEKRRATVEKIMMFYGQRANRKLEIAWLVERACAGIDPQRSHTFRNGKAGAWKNEFSKQNKDHMKQVAGDLLIKLGYEKDLDW